VIWRLFQITAENVQYAEEGIKQSDIRSQQNHLTLNKIVEKTFFDLLGNVYKDFPIEFWKKDLQENMGGDDPIFSTMVEKTTPKVIIEVGSWKGQSSISMAAACKKLKLDAKIICVDTWLGSEEHWTEGSRRKSMKFVFGRPTFYYDFLSNVIQTGHTETIIPLSLPSSTASKILNHFKIKAELIYIDGSHDAQTFSSDLKNYWELLAKDGVMFGHDVDWPDVKNSLETFCSEKNIFYISAGAFWFLCINQPVI
jgi:hypothetical protein